VVCYPWIVTKRALILVAAGLLPAGLGPAFAYASVAWVAPSAGRTISSIARALPSPAHVADTTAPEIRGVAVVHAMREPPRRLRATQPAPTSQRGILVRRRLVQQAVRRGIRPSGVAVAQTREHPAGLCVTGWGAAGAGFLDGDIITSVGGRTPRSMEDVIGAVAGAYRAES
jgi:hypothetical protein